MDLVTLGISLAVAVIPAGVSIWAALQSRRSADSARIAQIESSRPERLESRVSSQKYEVYSPLITVLGDALTPGAQPDVSSLMPAIAKFQVWASVYASDGALLAFGRLMQATFHDVPAKIMIRLYAEFVIEARKDMGDEATRLTVTDVLVPRIKDFYTGAELAGITLPFDELCRREDWSPPWARASSSVARP